MSEPVHEMNTQPGIIPLPQVVPPLSVPPLPPQTDHREDLSNFPPAGKMERVLAFLLDNVLYGSATKLATAIIAISFKRGPGFVWLSASAATFVFLVYWIYPAYYNGQTLGKKVFKLRMVRTKSATELSFLQILFRETIGRVASTIPIGAGYFMIIFRKDRRALHDMMAGTRVVSIAPPKA